MSVLASETASATAGREGRPTSPDGEDRLDPPPSRLEGTWDERTLVSQP